MSSPNPRDQLLTRSTRSALRRAWSAAVAAGVGLVLAACASPGAATSASSAEPGCPDSGEKFEVAKLYVEHNATDRDTGVHGFFGGVAWRSLCLTSPDGERLLEVKPSAALGRLAVSDLFFESREPTDDEVAIEKILADFPPGEYAVAGVDVDGVDRVGRATFTHAVPAPVDVVRPELAADEEAASGTVAPADGLVVEWTPGGVALDGGEVSVTGYQVIVTTVGAEDPAGWSVPVLDVHVGPLVTSLPVPAGFLQPGGLYELEVLVLEASGNQTITVGFFTAG